MNAGLRQIAFVILGLLLCISAALGQAPGADAAIGLPKQWSDPRLKATVSVSAASIYLGELLERMSAQSGVTLSMDINDRLSGIVIACDLKQVPLADVMNALSSLLGCKGGEWEWKAGTITLSPSYLFRPTSAARQVPERLRTAMQERFEKQAAVMMQLASLPPEARRSGIEDLAPLLSPEDPEGEKAALQGRAMDESFWAVPRLFGTLLSPDQRLRLLREEGAVDILLNTLSADDRQAVKMLETGTSDGMGEASVDRLRFESRRYKNGAVWSLPSVMFGLERGEAAIGLHGFLGASPYQLAPVVYNSWLLPGDMATSESESLPIVPPADLKLDVVWQRASVPAQRIAELAAVEKVSFLAALPTYSGFEIPPSFGQTPKQYFEMLWRVPRLMHKWRSGVLLVHYPEWFFGDDTLFPYSLVKRLRTALQRQDGLLTLEDVAAPVLTLNSAQLGMLTAEIPFTGTRILTMGQPLQPMTALCAFYRRYPRAWSEQGLPLDLKLQTYLQEAKFWPALWEEKERATAVRITDVPDRWATDVRHTYTLQLHTTKRDWIDIAKFATVRIPSPTPP